MTSIMKTVPRLICRASPVCSAIDSSSTGYINNSSQWSPISLRFQMTETFPGQKSLWAILIRVFLAAALVLPAFGASAGLVLTSLHSFQVFTNGVNPRAGLVQGSDGNFYGTTDGGGTNTGTNSGAGTVFKISDTGALTTLYSFTGGKDGASPRAGLVQGSDGNFYGTTANGGGAVTVQVSGSSELY